MNPAIGRLVCQGLGFDDFTNFTGAYLTGFNGNFDKPGLNLTAISSNMSVVRCRRRPPQPQPEAEGEDDGVAGGGGGAFLLTMAPAVPAAHTARGALGLVELLIELGVSPTRLEDLNVTMQWANKIACHAPETFSCSSVPRAFARAGWRLDKLGSAVDPLDANLASANGGFGCNPRGATCGVHLHAVQSGATYLGPEGRAELESVDSALVSVGMASPLPTPLTTPAPRGGIHFALYGNIWNTNCGCLVLFTAAPLLFFFYSSLLFFSFSLHVPCIPRMCHV